MAGDASPSSSKGAGHRKQASLNSLGDDGYSEGGSFSGRDSYMDEREGGMRGFDFDPEHPTRRTPSFAGSGKEKGEGIGSLARLVEALEMYDNPHMDSYMSDEQDGSLGAGLGSIHPFGGMGLGDDMDGDEKALLGGGGGKRKGGYAKSCDSFGYAAEMNPKLKGKKVPLLEEEPTEEYVPPPFNANAPEGAEAMERGESGEVLEEGEWPRRPFKRGWKFNIVGMILMIIFVLALGFYLWVRITKTLDLGQYTWYGWMVLIVEMLGATSTILYGLNIILDPVHEKLEMEADNPGITKTKCRYHVRVLVPCYKEPLEITARTVQAAYNARLPAGCDLTIYLCDDGKDPQKRKWCEQMGPDIVYVSGRIRKSGEMNGKSANLNNCLSHIYPVGTPIPANEITCIFDADQVANPDFFLKTLPLFDAGDDVGMVLSPQAFHNLAPGADIFNHGNIQFWEYAQHGYDALGFISCTGTNFLTRSLAFEQAGWSPEYTLTEDYALGMELRKRKWKCRYVEEYLAVGEAPEQVRNCFQQRSRWAKGHFQIVLSNEHCPLFQKDLSWFQRLMYCSGVWSYVVGAITAPMFIAIPLVTIWAGVFPIVVSWWAAVGLTVYFLAQYMVLNYVRKFNHIKPLWFANVANNILWWTFVKACWRAVGSTMGKGITFKTTLKGRGMLIANSIGDLWMPTLCFLGLLASLGFGMFKVFTGPTVVTTLSISLVWIIYSAIPPYLLLHYNFIGRGATLRWACTLCFLISSLCGIAAITLLWLVYPTQYDYSGIMGMTYRFYDAERVGALPANYTIPWRGPAFLQEVGPKAQGFGNMTGGFMTGGQAGTLKMTIPTAFSMTMLAWGMLEFPHGYAKANTTNDALDTLKWGTDYLLRTLAKQTKAGQKYPEYNIAYQVGNYSVDRGRWDRPENMKDKRPVYYVPTKNGTSDLGGQIVAALASTAMVFQDVDSKYSNKLMKESLDLYAAISRKKGMWSDQFLYACAPPDPTATLTNPIKPSCKQPDVAFRGSMVYWYNSTSWRDDMAWAAAWMFRASGDPNYLSDAYGFYRTHKDLEGDLDIRYLIDWDNMIYPTTIMLAMLTDNPQFHSEAQAYLQKWLCSSGDTISYTPLGRAYNRFNPALGQTMNAALVSVIYGQSIQPPAIAPKPFETVKYNDGLKSQKYICWTRKQMRYVLGDHGVSYVTGLNAKMGSPQRVYDRGASCPSPPQNCSAITALYNPTPNPHVLTGALVMDPRTWDFFDDNRSSNDTWVSVDNNVGLTGALAGLNQVTGTYDQCLQGYGILARDAAICDSHL
ncbi:hypothetical protein WJX75_007984 [Coccomyxa subellipsoidea]|uniref:cellulase n=1 Tax=Coccomyxa subellipsoidea TaxID=248742 RepID=A0ABR2YFQ8_9CHLO